MLMLSRINPQLAAAHRKAAAADRAAADSAAWNDQRHANSGQWVKPYLTSTRGEQFRRAPVRRLIPEYLRHGVDFRIPRGPSSPYCPHHKRRPYYNALGRRPFLPEYPRYES